MTPRPLARLSLCLLFCLPSITVSSHAQTAAAGPESVLRTQLIGQKFVLRSMSAATTIHGSWDGNKPTLDPAPWHILAALTVHHLQLKGNQVTLETTRNQIVRHKTGKLGLSSVATPVTLTLTLKGDPATLAPTLRDAIFFPGLDAALAAVPKDFQKEVPPRENPVKEPPQPVCDCTDTTGTCRPTDGAQYPKLLSSAEPEFTDEARQEKINGSVTVGIRLNETGAIVNEWLVNELGYGLDEQAAIAVRQYKFAPATCHSKPTSTTIFVVVNFQFGNFLSP